MSLNKSNTKSQTLRKKWSFALRISSVNVTKSAVSGLIAVRQNWQSYSKFQFLNFIVSVFIMNSFMTEVRVMYWFLYDRNLRHKKVKQYVMTCFVAFSWTSLENSKKSMINKSLYVLSYKERRTMPVIKRK